MSRKVAATADGGIFDMWGDGEQTRSFLFIAECLEGSIRLMRSDWSGPVIFGSEEMLPINQLADLAMEIAGKQQTINYIDGPLGVRGRNSDNRLVGEKLGWKPSRPLREGWEKTYAWIVGQVDAQRRDARHVTMLSC